VLLVYARAAAKPKSRSGAISCIEAEDRFARADSIGVPIDVAAYRDHRLKADATARLQMIPNLITQSSSTVKIAFPRASHATDRATSAAAIAIYHGITAVQTR
jgi:hypothetical protein